jgi:hypothetical protein
MTAVARLTTDSLPALPPETIRLNFRPGVARADWEQLYSPTLEQILQAACRALSIAPARLEIEATGGDLPGLKPGTRSGWILGPAQDAAGRTEFRRLCRIDGVTAAWLTIALGRLQASGWLPPAVRQARTPDQADLKRRQGHTLTPAEQALLTEI